MTFKALANSFAAVEDMPVPVDFVLGWIRDHTDHKDIRLYPVERTKKAFRGGFRRVAIPIGPYGADIEIVTQIFYGEDLDEDWRRLVVVKEALHIFDGSDSLVDTPEKLRKLIPGIIARGDLQGTPFAPAVNDTFGAFRAMAVLLPAAARTKLTAAVEANTRTVEEVARYVHLPVSYVDIWLKAGGEIAAILGL